MERRGFLRAAGRSAGVVAAVPLLAVAPRRLRERVEELTRELDRLA